MTPKLKFAGLMACTLFVAACADDPYEPIVDGQKDAKYQSDLAACRQLSLQKDATNTGRNAGAAIGGLAGAASADDGDELGGAVVGAVIGGVIGTAEETAEVGDARDQIVFNCMRGRNHNVVG